MTNESTADVLELPQAELREHLAGMTIDGLAALRVAEQNGENRLQKLALLDNRIGELAAAGALRTASESAQAAELREAVRADAESTAQEAGFELGELEPSRQIGSAATLGPELASLLLSITGGQQESEDIFAVVGRETETAIESGKVTHTGPGKMWLWRKTAFGWEPRPVVSTNARMAIRGGMLPFCGDCRRATCGLGGDRNECPGRDVHPFTTCPHPTCTRKFYDPGAAAAADPEVAERAGFVNLASHQLTTPENRLNELVGVHVRAYHSQEAGLYGYSRPVSVAAPAGRPQREPQQQAT